MNSVARLLTSPGSELERKRAAVREFQRFRDDLKTAIWPISGVRNRKKRLLVITREGAMSLVHPRNAALVSDSVAFPVVLRIPEPAQKHLDRETVVQYAAAIWGLWSVSKGVHRDACAGWTGTAAGIQRMLLTIAGQESC